jgi:peptide/nickel transport system permease protein
VARLFLLRLLAAVPVLLAAAVVTFLLFEVVPGDAAVVALGDRASPSEVAALRHEMGLDRPAAMRFASFLVRLGRGDLGRSVRSGRPVAAELADRVPYTLGLTVTAVAAGLVLGVVAGALAAARAGGELPPGNARMARAMAARR